MPADDTATVAAPIVLGYGDIAVQRGVTVTRDGATLRIRVPPRPLFPIRSATFAFSLVFVAFCFVGMVAKAWVDRPVNGLGMLLLECFSVGGSAVLYRRHMRSPSSGTIFELTDQILTISADKPPPGLLKAEGKSRWSATRPRRAIAEIRYNPYDGALLIRAAGHNLLLGLLQNEDRRVVEYVAETLTAELTPKAS